MPFSPSSVALARQRLKEWMVAAGSAPDSIDDARVVVSELVGNSIRHARPLSGDVVLVSWSLGEKGLRLSVTDGGSAASPQVLPADSAAIVGRGMAIVDKLTTRWWAERNPSRCTVHAVLSAG